ncbi:MAG TPA: AI-2E family transporter [Chloroflexota bacterium]|nr:AI-2E family transporter [Chloroflexota bacterium]
MDRPSGLSGATKILIVVGLILVALVFLAHIRGILFPFLWALVAAYLLSPIVNYLNIDGHLPRLWSVILIYASAAILLLAGSRYLYPQVSSEVTVFLEDLPRLEVSLIAIVGPRPLGIDIASLVAQLLHSASGYTESARSAGHLLVNAFQTALKTFLFLVATFYLLIDGPRLGRSFQDVLPEEHRPELVALARQIHLTWQQYIRGELVLFAIMATATTIGLSVLGVPGSLPLGVLSGALEMLPLVGPVTAGALAVTVAYVNGTNPFGWSQIAYAGVVAVMYLVFRQAEDYFVVPHVLGRAVRLNPLVVLFSVTAGGVIGGLLGLFIAVPIAASIKAILVYLYAKLLDQPVEFAPVKTLGGGIIEIPVHDRDEPEDSPANRAGTS